MPSTRCRQNCRAAWRDAWRWRDGRVVGDPRWEAVLTAPRAKLHLYGKAEPRPGRKMGHFTVRDRDTMEQVRLPIDELTSYIETRLDF